MKINSINNINQSKYNVNNRKNNNNVSFQGAMSDNMVNRMSNVYESVAKTKPFQKFVGNFSKSNKTFTHLLVIESCILSGFYMINTIKDKKIEKEQKPQMVLNDAMTLGLSTAGAYLMEDKITDAVVKGSEKYFSKHSDFYMDLGKKAQEKMNLSPKNELLQKVEEAAGKKGEDLTKCADDIVSIMGTHLKGIVSKNDKTKTFQITSEKLNEVQTSVKDAVINNAGNAGKTKETVKNLVDDVYNSSAARAQADKTFSGINKLKVLVIFGIIYRYLGPVIFTPIANKLSSKLFENKKEDNEKIIQKQNNKS